MWTATRTPSVTWSPRRWFGEAFPPSRWRTSLTNAANHIFGPRPLARLRTSTLAFKGDATAAFYRLENAAQT